MATNDFITDLVNKLSEDNIEYILIAVQKGKKDHMANAQYIITTIDVAEMILCTVDEVFKYIDSDDPDPPDRIEKELPDRPEDDMDYKEGAD